MGKLRAMDFKVFFFDMPVEERDAFAAKAQTSRGMLTQVAYRNKRIELGLADVICALSAHRVTLDDLPLTQNAARQREIRQSAASAAPSPEARNAA